MLLDSVNDIKQVILQDGEDNTKTINLGTESGITYLPVSDTNVQILLTNILTELKKMNLHLSIITNHDIKNMDVSE